MGIAGELSKLFDSGGLVLYLLSLQEQLSYESEDEDKEDDGCAGEKRLSGGCQSGPDDSGIEDIVSFILLGVSSACAKLIGGRADRRR